MRLLLLSCNTGGGHNTAATALKKCFEEHGVECDTMDALLFASKMHSVVISGAHSCLYRYFPRLNGAGYRYEESHPPRFFYRQVALGAKRFAAFLADRHYDGIVATHVFGNMLVTEARKKYGITIPHYAVITDYALWPGTNMVDAQRFFIASEQLRNIHIEAGIDAERLVASGIPIHSDFLNAPDKHHARKKLGLNPEGKVVLLISGSIGCGKLNIKAPEFEKKMPENTQLVIICGRNERLYKQVKEKCSDKTIVIGFTDRIVEYMAAADLCVTKPGGLSTTEAWAIGLPMILMLSIPGCETHNMEHFTALNIAMGTDDWDDAIQMTTELIQDDERLSEMRKQMVSVGFPGGTEVVVETVLSDLAQQG